MHTRKHYRKAAWPSNDAKETEDEVVTTNTTVRLKEQKSSHQPQSQQLVLANYHLQTQ